MAYLFTINGLKEHEWNMGLKKRDNLQKFDSAAKEFASGGKTLFTYLTEGFENVYSLSESPQNRWILMQCRNYWWSNLLYINNLYPNYGQDGCFAWAWNANRVFLTLYEMPNANEQTSHMVGVGIVNSHGNVCNLWALLLQQPPRHCDGQNRDSVLSFMRPNNLGSSSGVACDCMCYRSWRLD
ncbi:hypothetical protein DPMN_102618 [Dreissena polymorpha]|uniref:Uncharacterized protein n=1 Tax=Dreissena polymorpha TaxID=45954 RepID=A0A9D4LKP4_DREPO|nr:hypothetical protein DPMN_102618 [Dreissena polymorpha]